MAKKFGIFAETPIQTQPVPVKICKGPPVLSLAVLLYFLFLALIAWQLSVNVPLRSDHHFQTMSTVSVFKFKTAKSGIL
jgi:hypothetical protein